MCHPKQRDEFLRIVVLGMIIDYMQTCSEELRRELMESHDSRKAWIKRRDGKVHSFIVFFSFF